MKVFSLSLLFLYFVFCFNVLREMCVYTEECVCTPVICREGDNLASS